MCGIAGEVNFNKNIKNNLKIYENMQKSLKNRGPDQEEIYLETNICLIHTRLCIIDVENGKQPMIFRFGNKKYILVYNGELYNTDKLRQELEVLGHKFIGYSDTEVLLHCYIEWQAESVNKLNGIFAFAIWEEHNQKLFVARDRMGVKPFFYYFKNNVFIFGSEIKSILKHDLIEAEIDINSISEIILLGPGRTPGYGVFKNIKELKPANCGFFDNKNKLKIWEYWKLSESENNDSFEKTIEKTRFLVKNSIERQLVSDVPVCTFLSGGIDSSIISSISYRYFNKKNIQLQTFSVDYEDNSKFFETSKFQPNSDFEYIKYMNKYLKDSKHYNIILNTQDLVNNLYLAVEARDLPGMADIDSSLLLFCKEIKKFAKVALSGECADEIFGGYPWYKESYINRDNFPWSPSSDEKLDFLKPEFSDKIENNYLENKYQNFIENLNLKTLDKSEKNMKELINLNLKWFMQTLLDRKDRMSMYNGLEVRVPYCDYKIAEYVYNINIKYKKSEKYILREAMKDFLPKKVLNRKKSPYPKTHNPEYLKIVSEKLEEIINNYKSPILNFVKKDKLENLIKIDNNKNNTWYGQLMSLPQTIAYFLQVNYWLIKYNIKIK
ncbi:MAG: asparagine synthase [Candidatus Paraimprobicoccus trichonymphae]|uniref:asparagine synthase (glutamine-hydrolyzing) n=1 Tax=Candidatus Paraimprobicoccus trichonymphae TaxID=3033793 RepID=A0AA48KXP7_9FIRM|nr:MAG: asparagine synthase [Candidatus Paraimprobicoccus trichonymphae]